ncbi:tRNA pseudouridine(55) synthase TruB [Myxococcota bacterium]|nr:tRNA pseudouridine(55) synthase TruB [Myxococcota bacterium]MBU1379488.1 tRNA pseudouridine(55) synthase TruB [Myxococcota bacterium]MBU1497915.1 tRNA pseudouridine(55) synthase TruB [Myxococcota bacterium]
MVSGLLCVDKPRGITSHKVASLIKKKFRVKTGHAGTLDPLATGVLIVLCGDYTRLSDIFMSQTKVYSARVKMGIRTDSADSDGNIIAELPWENIVQGDIEKAMTGFRGEIEQIPPMFSAVKVNGQALYHAARRGETIDRKPRVVCIENLELTGFEPPYFSFESTCSKGTYIRQLAEDITSIAGCGGHITELRRLKSGNFSVDNSISLEALLALDEAKFESLLDDGRSYIVDIPELKVTDSTDFIRLSNGNYIKSVNLNDAPLVAAVAPSGFIAALGKCENGLFHPDKVLMNIIENFNETTQITA